MKRTLLFTALFLLLGIASWMAIRSANNRKGTLQSPDMEFAIPDTKTIGRIFIADKSGLSADLIRKADYWEYNGRYKARQSAIETLLETIAGVRVQYVPTDASKNNMVKDLSATGIKVMLFDRSGNELKTYYVGGVTQDERGTIMIMENSEQPYVVQLPGFVGQLRVRYLLGDDAWRNRNVFLVKPEKITNILVEYPQQKSQSFKLERAAGELAYSVKPFYPATPAIQRPLRKGIPESYLLQFESLGAEGFETNNSLRDSIVQLVPFAIVSVQEEDGKQTVARFWPVEVETKYNTGEPHVVRYFTDCNQGESFLLTQHRVFEKIFRGYPYFFEAPAEKIRQ